MNREAPVNDTGMGYRAHAAHAVFARVIAPYLTIFDIGFVISVVM